MGKTLLYHDTFLMRGGAERLNIEIAKTLDADIATAIWSGDCYDAHSMGFQGEIVEVDSGFQKGMLGFLIMKWKFFTSKKLLKDYDKVIFSNEAITGIWGIKPDTKTYYYAHSISRHLFDQRDQYIAKVPVLIRPFFRVFSVFLRWLYKKEVGKIDTIFVNSKTNQKRISQWLDRNDAIIIYPSVDTEKFNIFDKNIVSQIIAIEGISLLYKEYYISFSRLTHAKRIDTIIRAFQQLPDKNVVILYGENDSQKDEFIEMGNGYPNIIFHTLKDNNNLPYIISGSLASISISAHEDFGMVAIESMACGVPVISVDEGGYRESILEGKTGYMLDPNNLERDLVETIRTTDIDTLQSMGKDCRKQSENFDTESMNAKIRQYIQ